MATQDQVILDFNGSRFVLPAKAGMAVFAALSGADIFRLTTRWERVGEQHEDVMYITPASTQEMPSLRIIGPAQFHVGIENQRVKEEEERKKNAPAT
jgi:hypothetical protein